MSSRDSRAALASEALRRVKHLDWSACITVSTAKRAMHRIVLVILFVISLALPTIASSTNWDGKISAFQCDQNPNIEMTLGEGQQIKEEKLRLLCTCIWDDKINVGGWEREALAQIGSGKDPGFVKSQGAMGRLYKAVKACSPGTYVQVAKPGYVVAPENEQMKSNWFPAILGLVTGGPFGFFVAPLILVLVGSNYVLWTIIGVFAGPLLWQIFSMLFFFVIYLFSKPKE